MASEDEARAAVVAEAMTWLGTPYHHRAAVKGAGADCAMFPLAVYKACGIIPAGVEPEAYPRDWHLHRSEERYLAFVEQFAREIPGERAREGDFVVFKFGRAFSHGAILIGDGRAIHAFAQADKVTVDDITAHAELKGREAKLYSVWG